MMMMMLLCGTKLPEDLRSAPAVSAFKSGLESLFTVASFYFSFLLAILCSISVFNVQFFVTVLLLLMFNGNHFGLPCVELCCTNKLAWLDKMRLN